jgi:hypothetical protein
MDVLKSRMYFVTFNRCTRKLRRANGYGRLSLYLTYVSYPLSLRVKILIEEEIFYFF